VQRKTSRDTFTARSTENGTHSILITDAMELGKKALVPNGDSSVLQPPDLDAFLDPNEEVMGIITMEDVMEELLQVILDRQGHTCFLTLQLYHLCSCYTMFCSIGH